MPFQLILGLLLAYCRPAPAEALKPIFRGACASALTYNSDHRRLLPQAQWTRLLDLLPLDSLDRAWAGEFMEYFTASFEHAAAGKFAGDLHAPYLATQARALLRLYDEVIDERAELIDRQSVFAENELREWRLLFAGKKMALLRSDPQAMWRKLQTLTAQERKVHDAKEKLVERVDEDWRTLRALRAALASQAARGPGPDLATLLQFQIFALAIIQDAESYFGLGDQIIGGELRDVFGLDLRFDQEEIRRWANLVERDPLTTYYCGTTGKEVRHRLETVSYSATTLTPVIAPVSDRVRLALGFLPLEYLPLSFDSAVPTRSLAENWNAHPIWPQPHGGLNPFARPNPRWARSLNQAWNNWYLLLGGQLRDTAAIHQPTAARAAEEELVHALMHVIRYTTLAGDGHEWANTVYLIDLLYHDTLIEEPGQAPRMDSALIREVEAILAAQGRPRKVEPRQLAAALDLMIARLYAHPKLKLGEELGDAIRRAPIRAVSRRLNDAKIWEPRRIEDQRPPGERDQPLEPSSRK